MVQPSSKLHLLRLQPKEIIFCCFFPLFGLHYFFMKSIEHLTEKMCCRARKGELINSTALSHRTVDIVPPHATPGPYRRICGAGAAGALSPDGRQGKLANADRWSHREFRRD